MYWSGRQLICFNPRVQQRFAISTTLADHLSRLDDWTTPAQFAEQLGSCEDAPVFRQVLAEMASMGVAETDRDREDWSWSSWSPEASFFFFGTRGGKYPSDPLRYDAKLRKKAKTNPPPVPVKSMAGPRFRLPEPRPLGDLSVALHDRRTWRHFSTAPVSLDDLATVLRSTWGVQKWGAVKGQGRVPLKTSPSGGARHAIEAYVLARNVRGLPASVYHYDAARHDLVRLGYRVTSQTITKLLVNQFYYRDAAAIVVMTAVFPRAMWRYPFSRALRTVLTEAGHLGQTFCLTATSLGLAPFTVMAFDEVMAESLLTVDGVNECALYVVGVGNRSVRHAAQPGGLTKGDRP